MTKLFFAAFIFILFPLFLFFATMRILLFATNARSAVPIFACIWWNLDTNTNPMVPSITTIASNHRCAVVYLSTCRTNPNLLLLFSHHICTFCTNNQWRRLSCWYWNCSCRWYWPMLLFLRFMWWRFEVFSAGARSFISWENVVFMLSF